MAKIKKIQESGETIYPATIFQAIKNPKNGQTLEKSFESEHKKLTAGFAYEILGDGQATAEQFSFRPTATENKNVRDGAARIEKVKGSSLVWNVNGGYKPNTTHKGVSIIHYNDGVIELSGELQGGKTVQFGVLNNTYGHIYLVDMQVLSMGDATSFMCGNLNIANTTITQVGHVTLIKSSPRSEIDSYVGAYNFIGSPNGIKVKYHQFDLTQMFDAGNEPTTVEQFYELLPEGVDINAYNEGEIVDANYKAIKTTGFNQWDEQWENGYYDSSTGLPVNSNALVRSKNYNRILPNTKYFCKSPDYIGYDARIFFYTRTKEYIKSVSFYNTEITPPSDAYYFHLKLGSNKNKVPTYNHDVCINIAWDEYSALNGTYKPYKPFERDLSWIKKYFPEGMRSAGSVRDEIRFNSTTQKWEAVQRIGVVDLGSLTWTTDTIGDKVGFVVKSKVVVPPADLYSKANMLCSKYVTVIQYGNTQYSNDKVIFANGNGWIQAADYAYTDAAAFKAAMAGVMLNYELAEPIVTTITEDVNLAYDVADYGTEELIVAEGEQSAPLCADIVYAPNALSTIKNVPDIFTRLAALEAALATLQASVVANTNEE